MQWRVGHEQLVRQGEIICDVVCPLAEGKLAEATMRLEAYEAGTVYHLTLGGAAVEMGNLIGWIETNG